MVLDNAVFKHPCGVGFGLFTGQSNNGFAGMRPAECLMWLEQCEADDEHCISDS